MKISVSLPEDDITFIDGRGAGNRSAVLHEAIELLRQNALSEQYAEAYREWDGSEDARLWHNTSGDGIGA